MDISIPIISATDEFVDFLGLVLRRAKAILERDGVINQEILLFWERGTVIVPMGEMPTDDCSGIVNALVERYAAHTVVHTGEAWITPMTGAQLGKGLVDERVSSRQEDRISALIVSAITAHHGEASLSQEIDRGADGTVAFTKKPILMRLAPLRWMSLVNLYEGCGDKPAEQDAETQH